MLDYLRLQNFRSIYKAELAFSRSGLNVLVGANGSGKSNLVRALDFIADLQSGDLPATVATHGGQRSIIPKSIKFKKLPSTRVSLEYRISLARPPGFREKLPDPTGSHQVSFRILSRNAVKLESEILTFTHPLAVAEALAAPNDTKDKKRSHKWSRGRRSEVALIRTPDAGLEVTAKPKFSPANYEGYMNWFGFNFLESLGAAIKSPQELEAVIAEFHKRLIGAERRNKHSALVLQSARPLLALAPQVEIFRRLAQDIRRFDFHVSRLRGDKQPTSAIELEPNGENLPAVVRWLKSGKERASWERIIGTLSNIAPYIFDVRDNLLRSGNEYIEFFETRSGRPVESWDASDGTLRALAILIALESHPVGSTVIIEEPEKGLHPWAVRYLFDHIREVIDRRSIQIITTTHSAQVLEEAKPSEVIIVTRTHKDGTKMRMASDVITRPIKAGDLGRLWVKGLLGGHPHDV